MLSICYLLLLVDDICYTIIDGNYYDVILLWCYYFNLIINPNYLLLIYDDYLNIVDLFNVLICLIYSSLLLWLYWLI